MALLRADTARSAEAFARAIAGTATPDASADPGPVRFIGLGSSRFAALTVAAALAKQGRVARVEHASSEPAPALPGETVFAVSASGRTIEVIEAARRLVGSATVIAVTNDPGSPLAGAVRRCLPLHSGEERSGIATLTYRATLAVLALATGALGRGELRALLPLLGAPSATASLVTLLEPARTVDLVAEAGRLGSAEQAALLLREAPRLGAAAWAAEEWLHTAVYTALPGHRVLVLGRPDRSDELISTVEGRGGRAGTLEVAGELGRVGTAIVESIEIETLAAELWARAGSPSQAVLNGKRKGA